LAFFFDAEEGFDGVGRLVGVVVVVVVVEVLVVAKVVVAEALEQVWVE